MKAALISTMPGYGDSSAKTIVKNINKSREIPLAKFLAALNIPNVGNSAFTAVEKSGFDSLKKIQDASWKDFLNASGIGETTAKAMWTGLREKQHIIDQLLSNGVSIKRKVIGKLTGKSFCFTGEISLKRGNAMKLVEDLGGEVKTSVSKGLDYLVQANANSASTKSKKAREYGTKVIGEQEFFTLVDFSFKKLKNLGGN
jgi:DNA ligase (NAD+)